MAGLHRPNGVRGVGAGKVQGPRKIARGKSWGHATVKADHRWPAIRERLRKCVRRFDASPWLRLAGCVLLAGLVLGGSGGPQPGPGLPERLGSWPGFGRGPAADIAVANGHAFVAIEEGGLLVLDLADANHPARVASYPLEGIAKIVRLSGSRAYVACKLVIGSQGGCTRYVTRSKLVILDISDPANPVLLGTYVNASEIQSLACEGNRVYLSDGKPGLQVLDFTDPARPVALSLGKPDSIYSATATWSAGSHLYCLNYNEWAVVDLSQPTAPTLVTNFQSADPEWSLTLRGVCGRDDLVFVAEGDFGYNGDPDRGRLAVYGPSTPTGWALLGKIDLPGAGLNVAVEGKTAYVAAGPAGVITVDINDPTHPKRLTQCDTPGMAVSVVPLGTKAAVADYFHGLQILEIGSSNQLSVASNFDTGLTARKLRVFGNRAFLMSADSHPTFLGGYEARSRVEVLNIKDPAAPELLSTYEVPANMMTLDVAGNLVCLGYNRFDRVSSDRSEQRMLLVDFSEPGRPLCLSDTRVGPSPVNLALRISGNRAFVSSASEMGLQIFDLQNPAVPVLLGQTNSNFPYEEVRVTNGVLYLAHDSGLDVCGPANATTPQLLSSLYFEFSSGDDCDT